ncbi:MAG: hypothetical protein ABSB71_07920 [Candidatus Bathyarchaeia archaeon]|jgi:hypothetical protein
MSEDPTKALMKTVIEVFTNSYWCPIDKKVVYPNYSDLNLSKEELWCHCTFGTNHIKLNEFLKIATKEEIESILQERKKNHILDCENKQQNREAKP